MAINFGIALGKALESGLSTYERLGEEEMRDMQRKEMRRKMEEEQKLEQAFAQTQGRVGQADDYGVAIQKASGNTGMDMGQARMLSQQGALSGNTAEDIAFEKASAEAAAGALRENAARQGVVKDSALPEMKAEEYSQRQANKDYAKAAAGVSRKGYLEALALKKETRASELDDKFDLEQQGFHSNLASIHGTAESKGLKGLADLAEKNGIKVRYTEGKSGIGKIDVLGADGKVVQTISSVADATKALEQAAVQQFQSKAVGLLGGPDKLLTYLNQREELNIKKPLYEAQADEAKAKAGYFRAGGAAMNRPPKKEITNADFNSFLEKFGDKPSSIKDQKTGKALPISALPADKQWEEARRHYNAGGAAFAEDGAGGAGYNSKDAKGWNPTKTDAKTTAGEAIPTKESTAQKAIEVGLKQAMESRRMFFNSPSNYKAIAEDPTVPKAVREYAKGLYKEFEDRQSALKDING